MNFIRTGLFRRWTIGYLVAFLLLAASNCYSVWKLHQLGTNTIANLNVDIVIIDFQKKLVDSILSQRRYEQKYLLLRDEKLYDQFLQANKEFRRFLDAVEPIANDGAMKESLKKILNSIETYEGIVNRQANRLRDGRSYASRKHEKDKGGVTDHILEELKILESSAREDIIRRVNVANTAGSSAAKFALGAFAVTLLSALFMALLIARNITTPLTKLIGKTKEISQGVFKSNLKINSPPEIAELAKAFNSMCDKLSEVDRMKNDFLSMISHELRTPLTTVKEGTSLLLEKIAGEINQKQERLLSILADETNRLIEMVNSILELAKMEAGMMLYTFEPACIAPLIDQAITEITPLLQSKRIILKKEFIDNLQARKVDEARILQALRNLIANAAKFTPEGGRIIVAARSLKDSIMVSFEDTGPGIPEDRLSIIFEKFSGSDHKKGTGLGLAIVKHIIDGHGGRVWAESELKQGSKFIFVLPS